MQTKTCKDCLCYEACHYHITEETDMTVDECATGFKNKDEFVKLPAYVGQPVWLVKTWTYTSDKSKKVEICLGRVSMLQQKSDRSWKFRVSEGGSVCDCTLADIGSYVFFSEQAAVREKARLEANIL